MGGRGSRAGGAGGAGGGLGGLGGLFAATPNAGGGVTITPNGGGNVTPPLNAQALAAGGTGGSDVKTHTTYFTPADYAIVSNMVSDGYRWSSRQNKMVPVGYYQTSDYANINGELRDLGDGTRKALTPKTQKVVDAMDRNMRPLNDKIDTVRWTDQTAIAANLGMKGATRQQIINRLAQSDAVKVKSDYTSSSWDPKQNAVAGSAGRNVRLDMHYAKGAMVQFSPTRKEGEMVGARNVPQRYANARMERALVTNARTGARYYDNILVVDVYVDQ